MTEDDRLGALVGRAGEPFQMRVELGKVREFAVATKSTNAEYLEGEEPISPVTFLQVSGFWSGPGASPLGDDDVDYSRALHGGQEFVFPNGPPRAGTELTGRTRVDRVYSKEGSRGGAMHFVELVTDFSDRDGQLVAESRTTAIFTSKAPEAGA